MSDKISNARKKELEQPDPFIESLYRGMALARDHQKQLLLAGGILVAVILIVSGTLYSIRSSDDKAVSLLAQALETYGTLEPEEGYDAVQESLTRLISEYPNTGAGKMGQVRFAQICYDAGRYDQALTLYEGILEEFSNDPVMTNLIQVALGHTCQMLEKDDRAVSLFKAVAQGKTDFLKDEALFNLGLLAEKTGEGDKGLSYFNQIVSDHAQSIYSSIAQSRVAKTAT